MSTNTNHFRYQIGQPTNAIDINQRIATLLGWGVVEGGRPTEGGRPWAVDVLNARTRLDGEVITTDAVSVDISEYIDVPVDRPRKAILYIKSIGAESDTGSGGDEYFDVEVGPPATVKPDASRRFDTARPSPPDLSDMTVAPICELWIGGGQQQITDEDIRDRRLTPSLGAYLARAVTGSFETFVDGAGVPHTGELADVDDTHSVEDVLALVNNDPTHGSSASHSYFSGSHSDLADVTDSQHHLRYEPAEARAAVTQLPITELTGASAHTPGQHLSIGGAGAVGGGAGHSSFGYSSFGTPVGYDTDTSMWDDPPMAEAPVLASGTVTHTGGSETVELLDGITPSQTAHTNVGVAVSAAAPPAWNGNYGYTSSTSQTWDAAAGEIDIELTLSWTTDPGAGNDLEVEWTVYELTPSVVSDLYSGTDTRNAISDTTISVAGMLVGNRAQVPAYDEPTDSPATPEIGDLVVTTGNGVSQFGVFIHDGVAWQGPYSLGLTSLSELTIDVPMSWSNRRIRNVGSSANAGSLIRLRDITNHADTSGAHHEQTVSTDIDHSLMSNVQPDQHHPRVTADEMIGAAAEKSFSIPVTASSIPDSQSARAHAALGEDETLVLTRGEVGNEIGATPSGLSLQIAEAGSGTVYYTQTSGLVRGSDDDPITVIGGPASLDIRVRNQTGDEVAAGGEVSYHILRVTRTYGDSITFSADSSSLEVRGKQGVVVEPNVPIDGFRATISQLPSGYTTAYLHANDGTLLAQKDISDLNNGDTFEIDSPSPLEVGERYHVSIDSGGDVYTRGKHETTSSQFPYSTSDFDVVSGVYAVPGSTSTTGRYNLSALRAIFID